MINARYTFSLPLGLAPIKRVIVTMPAPLGKEGLFSAETPVAAGTRAAGLQHATAADAGSAAMPPLFDGLRQG